MTEETEVVDPRLHEHLRRALDAVPSPGYDVLVQVRRRVKHMRRIRGLVSVAAGASCAAVIGITVSLLPSNSPPGVPGNFEIVSSTASLPVVHRSTPSFDATTTAGGTFHLSSYRGKWIVVAFVSSQGCSPCASEEQAGLVPFAGEQDEQSRSAIVVVNEGSGSLDLPARSGSHWTVIGDSNHRIATMFGVRKLPYTVIVNPLGAIGGAVIGPADSGIIDYIVTPSQLEPLVTTTVGNCTLTISASHTPVHPGDEGREAYSFTCPNSTTHYGSSGIFTPLTHGPLSLLNAGGGAYVTAQYVVTDRRIVMVRLVHTSSHQIFESMSPVWDGNFGITAFIVAASTNQQDLEVQGVDSSGAVLGRQNGSLDSCRRVLRHFRPQLRRIVPARKVPHLV